MNIVIIDDDKLVALSLKTILESTGKITVLAMGESGKYGISLYDEYKLNLRDRTQLAIFYYTNVK